MHSKVVGATNPNPARVCTDIGLNITLLRTKAGQTFVNTVFESRVSY